MIRFAALQLLFLACSLSLFAQSNTPQAAPPPDPGHDITKVDPAPDQGAIAVPLPEISRRRMKRYEVPELSGARQALGSQLINGQLPKPQIDYVAEEGTIAQRLSIFEGGLVVVHMTGAGGVVRKKVIIPPDALKAYTDAATPSLLREVAPESLKPPKNERRTRLRAYDQKGAFVERVWGPGTALPKSLDDRVGPLRDLLRAIVEDRTVTSTVAGYDPKIGDLLVGDDGLTYRVDRLIPGSDVVELRCMGQPTRIFVARKDLYNYFVGARDIARKQEP